MYTMVLSAAGHKAPDFRELTFSETQPAYARILMRYRGYATSVRAIWLFYISVSPRESGGGRRRSIGRRRYRRLLVLRSQTKRWIRPRRSVPGMPRRGGRVAGFTNRQKSAQALASDASTAIIATTKATMMIRLPTITSQLPGTEIRLMA